MKTVTITMILSMVLTLVCCAQQENTQAGPEPPSMSLHRAALLGNIEVVRQHIRAGSDLNERELSMASSPLITAAVFGQTEVARALIEAGADVNYKNSDGSTALHTAAFFCRAGIVEILLENGADKELRNNAGATALEAV